MTRRARFVASAEDEKTVDDLTKSAAAGGIPISRQLIRRSGKTIIDIIYDETNTFFDPLKVLLGQIDRQNLMHHYDFSDHSVERANADTTIQSDARAHALQQSTGDREAREGLISSISSHGLNQHTTEALNEMTNNSLTAIRTGLIHRENLIHAYIDSNPDVSLETAKELPDVELRRDIDRKSARQRNGVLA